VAWTSVSPHGVNLAEPLREALAMAVANNTLFVAGYDRSARALGRTLAGHHRRGALDICRSPSRYV
jgi:hypothetical protein